MDIWGLCKLCKLNTLCGNLFFCHGKESTLTMCVYSQKITRLDAEIADVRVTKKNYKILMHFTMKSWSCRPTWHRLCTAAVLFYWERPHPFSFCCGYQTTLFQTVAQTHCFLHQMSPHNHCFHRSMHFLEVTDMVSHAQIWLRTW